MQKLWNEAQENLWKRVAAFCSWSVIDAFAAILMKEIGKKAEQQALAKYGLDFVTDTYLPEKLSSIGIGY